MSRWCGIKSVRGTKIIFLKREKKKNSRSFTRGPQEAPQNGRWLYSKKKSFWSIWQRLTDRVKSSRRLSYRKETTCPNFSSSESKLRVRVGLVRKNKPFFKNVFNVFLQNVDRDPFVGRCYRDRRYIENENILWRKPNMIFGSSRNI